MNIHQLEQMLRSEAQRRLAAHETEDFADVAQEKSLGERRSAEFMFEYEEKAYKVQLYDNGLVYEPEDGSEPARIMHYALRTSALGREKKRYIWSSRSGSLSAAIKELGEAIAQTQNREQPTDPTTAKAQAIDYESNQLAQLKGLSDELSTFTGWGFGSFTGAFDPESPFIPSMRYTFDYILRTLSSQIMNDVSIIQQAYTQRRDNPFEAKQETVNIGGKQESIEQLQLTAAVELYAADLMTNHALEPARQAKMIEKDSVAISYFQERTSIRVLPYHNRLLIGIPFANVLFQHHQGGIAPSFDHLALPHEVGHYLYWHGQIDDQPIYKALAEKLSAGKISKADWRQQWIEEIFADVYCCLIAGPIMVLGFQELVTDGPTEHFSKESGKHPIAELRPLILTRILRAMTDEAGKALYPWSPDYLDANWRRISSVGQNVLEEMFIVPGSVTPLSGQFILDELDDAIQIMLALLEPLRPTLSSDEWHTWSTDPSPRDVGAYVFLYGEYEEEPNKKQKLGDPIKEKWAQAWSNHTIHNVFADTLHAFLMPPDKRLADFICRNVVESEDEAQFNCVPHEYRFDAKLVPLVRYQILEQVAGGREHLTLLADNLPEELKETWQKWDTQTRNELDASAGLSDIYYGNREEQDPLTALQALSSDVVNSLKNLRLANVRQMTIDQFINQIYWRYTDNRVTSFKVPMPSEADTTRTPIMQRTADFFGAVARYHMKESQNKIAVDDWTDLFLVQGWSTEGPGPSPNVQ
ncbi:MAG: hypothetical protein AAF702_16910 [Chloroflexota bacterium]